MSLFRFPLPLILLAACEVGSATLGDDPLASHAADAPVESLRFTVDSTSRAELETIEARVLDADEDGYDDVLFTNQLSATVTLLWGRAGGVGPEETTVSMGRAGSEADVGDIDGDGTLDLIASNQDHGRYSIAWGTGDRAFGNTTVVNQGGFPRGVTLADADRDGDLDLVSVLEHAGCTVLRLNDGNGSFAPGGCWVSATNAWRAADLDGDGHDELVESRTGDVYSSAKGTFARTESLRLRASGSTGRIHPYDVDDDGDMDLVVAGAEASTLTTFQNDGTGDFREWERSVVLSYGPNAVGDLDQDGDLDYVSVETFSYCDSTWHFGWGAQISPREESKE